MIVITCDYTRRKITIVTDTLWNIRVVHDLEEGLRGVLVNDDGLILVIPPQNVVTAVVRGIDHLLTPEGDKIRFRDAPGGCVGNYKFVVTRSAVAQVRVERVKTPDIPITSDNSV